MHLNTIRVGVDNFTVAEEEEIDSAVQITRNIYATVNIGIGCIEHFDITVADANGKDVIADDAEAKALTDEWTVHNAFFVFCFKWMGRSYSWFNYYR